MASPKDLPWNVDPGSSYKINGKTLLLIFLLIKALWNGDNITRGPGIFKKPSDSGFILSSTADKSFQGSQAPHPLTVLDASTGSTPRIIVTPGAFNGSIMPTIGGIALNAPTPPTLTLSGTDTLAWFEITYNSSNVATAVAINMGTTLPTATLVPGTAGVDYYGLSTLAVTTGAKASVAALNDYVSGPQGYSQCGVTSNCWLK